MDKVNKDLKKYIQENVLTLYGDNIGGHGLDHINSVIDRSFELVKEFDLDVDLNMVYVVAAFHDLGYKSNPDEHEEVSSKMFISDSKMKEFFTADQINVIAEAIIDHRASLEYEARSVYGKIVSSADREISVDNMLQRSVLFQADKHKDENPTIMQVIDYSYAKLSSKYGKCGYAKMYYQDKKYIDYLDRMQEILEDKSKFVNAELELISKLRLIEIYSIGMLCKHFKGSDLLEKNIYRIEQLGVSGSEVDTNLITYTGVGVLEDANNLVVYSNIFQEGMLFAREYEDISAPLSSDKQTEFGQVMRVQPLTTEESELINKPDFIEKKKIAIAKKYVKK